MRKRTEVLTLRDYYEKTVEPLWEGSLSRNTHLSYNGSFRVHILPALGALALTDVTRDRVKKFVAELRKKTVTMPQMKESELTPEQEQTRVARTEQPRPIERNDTEHRGRFACGIK